MQWDARLAPGGMASGRGSRSGMPRWVWVALALLFLLLLMWFLSSRGAEETGVQASTDDVTEAVRIAESRAGYSNIDVEVADGRVVLSGELPDEKNRFAAEKVAYTVPGVVAVDNQIITVESEEPTVTQAPAEPTDEDRVLEERLLRESLTNPIVFGSNSAELDPVSGTTIDRVALLLEEYPVARIEVQGYTDSDGDEGANQTLSAQRAEVVLQQLVARGIGADRLTFQGFGEADPVASNDTKDGKAANRRIEFRVIPQ